MKNIEVEVTSDDKLILTIDLRKSFGDSSTGKTTMVASSGGNAKVPEFEGVQFGLNVFKKKKKADE